MEQIHNVILANDIAKKDWQHGSLLFIGTATTLLRYAGFTVLTDPNFLHQGEYVHLGYGLRGVRVTDPALEMDALPRLDCVVLSHMHEDHFDRSVARKLEKNVPIVTPPQAATALRKQKFRFPYALNTWETLTLEKGQSRLHITAMPAQHAPGPLKSMLPPVMGSMLEFERTPGSTAFRLYITGDTLMRKQLQAIPQRYPEIDLALLHLGGTRLLGVLLTMDAKQGVEAIRLIQPHTAIPIHCNDYNVFHSSLAEFQRAVAAAGLEKRVHYIEHGEEYPFVIPESRLNYPQGA
ncbi:MAG TPA: MBL fold metallo-hydrolase [Ktedonobacteraceae bacterium]|nr:MBL fold metallo-hydrolase [Ktedonobacteraceae bacterium]